MCCNILPTDLRHPSSPNHASIYSLLSTPRPPTPCDVAASTRPAGSHPGSAAAYRAVPTYLEHLGDDIAQLGSHAVAGDQRARQVALRLGDGPLLYARVGTAQSAGGSADTGGGAAGCSWSTASP